MKKYIYGVISEPEAKQFSFPGMLGLQVFTVSHDKLGLVVSNVDLEEIDPTRKNVRAHTIVYDELLRNYDVLPMQFGTIADSDDEVQRFLQANYDTLNRELKRLSGKIEVEIKIFWNKQAMTSKLESESEKFRNIKARINTSSSPSEAQNLMAQAGELVERAVAEWKRNYADRIYEALKALSIDARSNNLVGVENILNASFLLERSKEGEFQEEVRRLDSKYKGNMDFKYVGPLPPHNFVKLNLKEV